MKFKVFTMSQEKVLSETYDAKKNNYVYGQWYNAPPQLSWNLETKLQRNYFRIIN
jgi:hypothetical protein